MSSVARLHTGSTGQGPSQPFERGTLSCGARKGFSILTVPHGRSTRAVPNCVSALRAKTRLTCVAHANATSPSDDATWTPKVDPADFAHHKPGVARLNHGSFGASPACVLAAADAFRADWYAQPDEWYFAQRLPAALLEARGLLASALHAPGGAAEISLVENATVAAVVIAQRWGEAIRVEVARGGGHGRAPKVMCLNFVYEALGNVLDHYCRKAGAQLVRVDLPFPIGSEQEAMEAVERCIAEHEPMFALVDMITSQPSMLLPIRDIVAACRQGGVREVAVDGAHCLGNVAVDVEAIGADYFFSNVHKWGFAPTAACVLHTRILWEGSGALLHHPIISWSYKQGLEEEAQWVGTRDYSAMLAVPRALQYHSDLGCADVAHSDRNGGGYCSEASQRVMDYNRRRAVQSAEMLAEAWDCGPLPVPASMCSAMAMVGVPPQLPVPDMDAAGSIRVQLRDKFDVEAAIGCFQGTGYIRLSHQVYNSPAEFERLRDALLEIASFRDIRN